VIEIDLTVVGFALGFPLDCLDSQIYLLCPGCKQDLLQAKKSLKTAQAAYSSRFPALPAE
jgi:hypothetical protein